MGLARTSPLLSRAPVESGLTVSMFAAVLSAWVLACSGSQAYQAGTLLVGRVVDGVTGAAVAGAVVSAAADDTRSQAKAAFTDSQGHFVIRDVAAWPVLLRASRAGFIAGAFGQRYAGDVAVPLTAADARDALTVPLWPTATIAGSVLDETGAPMAGVRVQALRLQPVGGRKRFVVRGSASSNDRGQYRVSGLPSGSYMVAVPNAGRDLVELTHYYPATLFPHSALQLDLQPGGQQLNADFQIGPVQGRSIQGTLVGLPEGRSATAKVYHDAGVNRLVDMPVTTVEVRTPGHFRLPSLPSGVYRLSVLSFPVTEPSKGTVRARQEGDGSGLTGVLPGRSLPLAPVSAEPTLWADQQFEVNKTTVDLRVTLNRGARVRGRVLFEGDAQPPLLAQMLSMPVIVQPADGRDLGSFQVGGLDVHGRFETIGLPPGKYIPFVFPSLGWFQASVALRGVRQEADTLDLGSGDLGDVELHLARSLPKLQGIVRAKDGRPAPRATVYLFPESTTQWVDSGVLVLRTLECRSGADGRFERAGIPPGRYYVTASAEGRGEFWREMEILQTLRLGAKIVDFRVGEVSHVDLMLPLGKDPEG